jgi:predicted cupin superfamily sugar epimerase
MLLDTLTSETLVEHLNLKPHPEGGFAQTFYEDEGIIPMHALPQEFNGERPFWNAIYYLLPQGSKSILHKLRMNELWNFYLGGPLELYQLSPEGEFKKTILGNDIMKGQKLVHVFPKDHWIGAIPCKTSNFSLVSCVTAPGFTFDDWEKGEREVLLEKFPQLTPVIKLLTN